MEQADISIEVVEQNDLAALSNMLFHSELGKKYYPSEKLLFSQMTSSFETDVFYKLCDNKTIIGFIWFQTEGAFHTYMYLHMIFIKEEYKHLGYGKKLMECFERDSLFHNGKKKLQNKLFLTVGTWNTTAIKFYEDLGYTSVSTVSGLFRKNIDENLMMKECFSLK